LALYYRPLYSSAFFLSCSAALRDLPPFPTRRSSDLGLPVVLAGPAGAVDPLLTALPGAGVVVPARAPGAEDRCRALAAGRVRLLDRKSTRLNSSHSQISYAVFCLKKKK